MKIIFLGLIGLTLVSCASPAPRPNELLNPAAISASTSPASEAPAPAVEPARPSLQALAETKSAPPFRLRAFTTETLKNGLKILWLPDPSLPYLSFQMMVKAGSAEDPVGREGLALATARLLSEGTAKRGAPQIDEEIEQIGGAFGREVQADVTVISTSALSFNRDSLLDQYREVLLEPSFPAKEFDRERRNLLGGLKKLGDSPEGLTEMIADQYFFGSHAYAHATPGTIKSLSGLKRADLEAFYARYYRPSNAVLAITGQYDEAFANKIRGAFSNWADKTSTKPELADTPAPTDVQILLVNRDDLNQAQIEIVGRGIARDTPQYLEVRAAAKILGDFFLGSRLAEEIRVKRGLTYGIRSLVDPRLRAGPFTIQTFTRVEKTGETVRESLNVYKKFVKEGVTETEVEGVKALLRGQFPRNFETPEALARQLLLLDLYGISADYLKNYYANLDKLSKDSVNAAIKANFHPEGLRIVVYAPRRKVESDLKAIAPVEVRDYREFLR